MSNSISVPKPDVTLSEETVSGTTAALGPARRKRSGGSVAAQKWSRIFHVYTSMLSLMLVLFFSITGVTLNHPTWAFGSKQNQVKSVGRLPDGWNANNAVDWFVVSEYLRNHEGLHGEVAQKNGDPTDASIDYKGPGYAATAFIKADGSYDLTVDTQGFMGVINDLHKGRDTRTSWKWMIDVIGIGLAFVSLSGVFLQFFLRKRRRSAFASVAVGTIIMAVLTWIAVS
jgi:uncharacterized protein